MAKNATVIAPLAPLNRGLFQKRVSSIGCSTRRSHQKKTVRRKPPAKKKARMLGAVHPDVGASITAYSSALSPAMDSAAPTRSRGGALGSFEFGMRKIPASRPTVTIGMFTRKIEPQ